VVEIRWYELEEAMKQIQGSNRREKAALLIDAVKAVAEHL
jgi:hypothetical protein